MLRMPVYLCVGHIGELCNTAEPIDMGCELCEPKEPLGRGPDPRPEIDQSEHFCGAVLGLV